MCVLAGPVARLGPSTYHKSILLVGICHELFIAFPNAQAYRPRCSAHRGTTHLTDDPEETANLPVKGLTRLQPLLICSAVSE